MALVMLMLNNPDSMRRGEMGARGFSELPRVGEHIED